jgi:class 3 adenylate cyclase
MGIKDDIVSRVNEVLTVTLNVRDGQVVPDTAGVNLSDGAVKMEAAFLYADLADSTTLARDFDRRTAARVVRAYLDAMSRLIIGFDGAIRSFDGDRVMGIFAGDSKRSNAAKCALKMNAAFIDIVRPSVETKFPSLKNNGYVLEHTAGADVGEVLVVRSGVRGSNDLVSIGEAPNVAARLSEIRDSPYRSFITSSVYERLQDSSKYSNGKNMWEARSFTIKGKKSSVYRSNFKWSL